MTDLEGTERLFWDAIRHPTGVDDFLADGDSERREQFERVFAETSSFPKRERVQVYADAYFYRLLGALAEAFPIVRSYLGRRAFHNLVTDYLLAHPSTNPNLHLLGDALPSFIAEHECSGAHPYLADFAAVERALLRAIDAEDAMAMKPSRLLKLSPAAWSRLELCLVPSARIVETRFDMTMAQRAIDAGEAPATPDALRTGSATLVFRRGFESVFRVLGPTESAVLGATRRGATFERLCQIADELGQEPAFVADGLRRWLADELFRESDPDAVGS